MSKPSYKIFLFAVKPFGYRVHPLQKVLKDIKSALISKNKKKIGLAKRLDLKLSKIP